MLREIVRFEWRYHTRQPSFLAACALFFLIGFGLTASGFGAQNVVVTSPFLVAETLGLASLFSVFAIAIFVSNAVIRDSEHRMEEIVFTTPIGRFNYILGRFAGAFAAATTSMMLAPIGMMLATALPFLDRARVGSFQLTAYLSAFVVFAVPSILFATALLFAIATITRSALATYTASVFIYVLYMAGAAVTGSPLMAASKPGAGGGVLASLVDPFGLSTFFAVTRYWTIAEKNARGVAFSSALLLNRAIWITIAIAIWTIAYRLFAFRLLRKAKEKRVKRDSRPATRVTYSRVEPRERAFLRSFTSTLRFELNSLLRSLPFLLLLALWFALALVTLRSDLFDGEYGSALYPTTALIVSSLQQPLSIIGLILIVYYVAEVFWREQRFRVASIVDATPIRGTAIVLAKWSAIVVTILIVIAIGVLAGVLIQITDGYLHFEPLVYLALFYLAGVPLALMAAAAVAIHALSPNKYAGLALVLLFVVASFMAPDHPLWHFAAGPRVGVSAMSGFSDSLSLFSLLMLHWSVIAIAFIAIAAFTWRRLRDAASIRVRALLRHRGVLASFPVIALLTGGCVYYDTNIRHTRETAEERLDRKAAYERRYRPMATMLQPRITDVITRVDLVPPHARISGDYTLLNDKAAPIASLLVSRSGETRLIQLVQPLQPGRSTTLHFEFAVDDVPENGALIVSAFSYPTLGYRANYEITDPRERAKRGLGASSTPESGDPDLVDASDAPRINLDATISTAPNQTAVAPGRLVREWREGDRHLFHYRSDAPIVNRFGFASARYAIVKRGNVSVFYDARHSANVPAMLDTARDTLAYCNREFGAYPHHQLKLVEVPAAWDFGGYALPDTILFSEKRTFLVDARDANRPDLVGRRVAHEVAHQWWGYQLVAASRGGATTLTESLAKYTELMVLERTRGRDQVARILTYEHDRYLKGRSGEEQREQPLVNAGEQPYLYYGKGAIVMLAIRDLIGEPATNLALRRLIAVPSPTTNDLVAQLRAVSNHAQYALVDSWLRQIVLYDFNVTSARANGATIAAARLQASPDGTETNVPLDEMIDVALIGRAGGVMSVQRVRLRSGVNEVAFDAKDAVAVEVDPYVLRIDRNRADNARRIER